MVQGLAFLSKKGFNPQNQVNRKHVWEAQQASKQEQERIRQRQTQLRQEREDEELCAARHGGDGSQAQLRFMYDEPPGLSNKEEGEEGNHETSASSNVVTQVQPGDDAAAAAFRRMLAQASTNNEVTEQDAQEEESSDQEQKLSFGPVLQGTTLDPNEQEKQPEDKKNLSALEKAVGRKNRGGALTLEEQCARFPQLKNAPMAKGMSLTDVNVNFKPLGSQLRNIKCLACGVWGHSRGDRECGTTGWDPFSAVHRPSVPTTIRPLEPKAISSEKRKHRREEEDDDASTSSSSSSSSDSRRKRKRKSRSKKKHKESKRHRRSRSESPSRRRRKSDKKKEKKKSSRDY
jgi:hypothetical protein